MKQTIKKLIAGCAVIAMAALVLTGCGVQVTGLKMQLPERVAVGESVTAVLTAEYDNAEAKDEEKAQALAGLALVWSSSDEAVAIVDENGVVTGVSGGTATITATAGELKVEAAITVFVPLEDIEVPKTLELALNKTESAKLAAKPIPANASVEGLPSFASSDETVATVSVDGTVTAVANGEAVITVTLGGKSAGTKVTVTTAATGIALEKTEGILYVGGSYTLQPYTLPEEAPESSYSYKSGNEAVATVSEAGVITAKSAGTAKITVTSSDGFEVVYTLTVKNKAAAGTGGGSTGANGVASQNGGTGGNVPSGGNSGNNAAEGGTVPPSETPTPEGPACGFVGPGHTEVGYCPICDITNGGHGPGIEDGQQGDGLEGDAW